jgi:hypothetical protein
MKLSVNTSEDLNSLPNLEEAESGLEISLNSTASHIFLDVNHHTKIVRTDEDFQSCASMNLSYFLSYAISSLPESRIFSFVMTLKLSSMAFL